MMRELEAFEEECEHRHWTELHSLRRWRCADCGAEFSSGEFACYVRLCALEREVQRLLRYVTGGTDDGK